LGIMDLIIAVIGNKCSQVVRLSDDTNADTRRRTICHIDHFQRARSLKSLVARLQNHWLGCAV